MPPTLIDPPQGDAFASRNECALAIDYEEAPPMFRVDVTRTTPQHGCSTSRAPKNHTAGGRCAMTKHDILLDVQHVSAMSFR